MPPLFFLLYFFLIAPHVVTSQIRQCSKKEDLPRIVYLILTHNEVTLKSANKLITVLYDKEHYFFVHVDAKYVPVRRGLVEDLKRNRTNVEWAQIYDVQWARWSMVEPTLWAMEQATKKLKQWDFFINLSGDSWPVLRPLPLRQALAAFKGLNFVSSSPQSPTGLRATARSEFGDGWHKKEAYPHPMLDTLPNLETHYGSQWMILSRDFVDFIQQQLQIPQSPTSILRDWFVHAFIYVKGVGNVRPHIPDETFFPSLLAYHHPSSIPRPIEFYTPCLDQPNQPIPLKAAFYIRMDEHYPWSQRKQRYLAPDLDKSERPWGPYFLGAYDLHDIRDSGAFFVRKVSQSVDPAILNFLPVDHHHHIPPLAWPPHAALALSLPEEKFHTIDRGPGESGCVRVAESIHCPPRHQLRSDVAESLARLEKLSSLQALPSTTLQLDEDDSEL